MLLKRKWALLLVGLLLVVAILLLVPIPYFQAENAHCKPNAIGCPEKGWKLGPSIVKQFDSSKQPQITAEEAEIKFTGKVTARKNDCFADGVCSLTVNGKEVITNEGDREGLRGHLIGSYNSAYPDGIGAKVEVYAKVINRNSLTIYGNEKYYVKYLD